MIKELLELRDLEWKGRGWREHLKPKKIQQRPRSPVTYRPRITTSSTGFFNESAITLKGNECYHPPPPRRSENHDTTAVETIRFVKGKRTVLTLPTCIDHVSLGEKYSTETSVEILDLHSKRVCFFQSQKMYVRWVYHGLTWSKVLIDFFFGGSVQHLLEPYAMYWLKFSKHGDQCIQCLVFNKADFHVSWLGRKIS